MFKLHRKKLIALSLAIFMVSGSLPVWASEGASSILRCNVGNILDINVNGEDAFFKSSDESIAKVNYDKIEVIGEGTCALEGNDYTINIVSSAEGNNKQMVNVDYTYTDSGLRVSSEDKGKSRIKVEKNSIIELSNVTSIPDSFKSKGNGYIPSLDGTYLIGDVIVEVFTPQLSTTYIKSSIGYSEKLNISDDIRVVATSSSNEDVVRVDKSGKVSLVGEGSAVVKVDTGSNILECHVESVKPFVDESEGRASNDGSFKINVENNLANLPVTYTVVEGQASVSEDGLVSGISSDEVLVNVKIGNVAEYNKRIVTLTEQEKKWQEMQPAIQECLGTPYLMGGETPGVALDCSAYVSYVYRSVGLMSDRRGVNGIYALMHPTDNPQPGDAVFFHTTYDTDAYLTHIGLYAGDGMMYHSGDPNQLVSLNNSYWQKHFAGFGTFW